MRQFFEIFKFEFSTFYKQKSFIITTLIFILGIGAVLFFPRVSAMFDTVDDEQGEVVTEQSSFLLNDSGTATPQQTLELLAASLPGITFESSEDDISALTERVTATEYDGALYIDSPLSYTLILPTLEIFDQTSFTINEVLQNKYRIDILAQSGVEQSAALEIMAATVNGEVVTTGNDQTQNFFYSYILMFILYILIITYGSVIAVSVASEKSSRAMEMLITSADTKSLMFGKVLGSSLACIGQFTIVLFCSYIFYSMNAEYLDNPFLTDIFAIPVDILIYAVVFCMLGFFIYAMLFGALGSLVSKTEEVNSALTPVMLPFVGTFLLVVFSMTGMIGGGVDGTLMKVLSFIPLSSPFAMFVRISMGEVTGIEIAISIALLIATVFLTGLLTAKIYRVGVLLYGTPIKLPSLIKAVRN